MLRTKRLVLRPLRAGDEGWITRHIADPEVHRWLTSVPHPYAAADGAAFVERFAGRPGTLALVADDVPCGVLTIEHASRLADDRPAEWELGYWLRRDHWGRGLMTEAAEAAIRHHRAEHGATLHSGWITGNAGSARVLAKLGFQGPTHSEERHAFFHGRPVTVERVILPADAPFPPRHDPADAHPAHP